MAAAGLAIRQLVAPFANHEHRIGGWGAAWFVCLVTYFAFSARHCLILSPEKEFALSLTSEPSIAPHCEPSPLAPSDAEEAAL